MNNAMHVSYYINAFFELGVDMQKWYCSLIWQLNSYFTEISTYSFPWS